jgi:UDP-GlcNAc:undecaprenyl-phosphate GlcNAc-1-phosphate transferase
MLIKFSPLLIFILSLNIYSLAAKYATKYYAFDEPSSRKIHKSSKSLIGGLVFSLIFLVIGTISSTWPIWFILGGIITIILGAVDDNYDLKWYQKLFVQILIYLFISFYFFNEINEIIFFNYSFNINQYALMSIFLIWFIGIYNSVNLIDGLDGLAAGIIIFLCITISQFQNIGSSFIDLNIILAIILLSYMVYNQRPSKIFMGDAGSLFLGYFISVLPLLNKDLSLDINSTSLNMTPYLILSGYLIADTSRVFFTRLLLGKSPMNADTIHLHHLVIQKSGSYLSTIFIIFLTVCFSCIFSILAISNIYSEIGMYIYLFALFLFILTPPTPTYVSIISKIVKPLYNWDKFKWATEPKFEKARTYLILILLLINITLLLININNFNHVSIWQLVLSLLFFILYLIFNHKKRRVTSAIQLYIILLIMELASKSEISNILIFFVGITLFSLTVFTIKRIKGTSINQFSALDILIFIGTLGIIILSTLGFQINYLLYLAFFSIWFSLGFIIRRSFSFT